MMSYKNIIYKMMDRLRDYVVRWKFRISYLSGFITTFAGILIIASTIQDKLSLTGIILTYVSVLSMILILVLLCAYILDRLGFIDSEIEYSNSKNRMLKEIHKGGR